ncbi:MAG: preprotein translocase subunit SecG [Anaerolineae bacterium]
MLRYVQIVQIIVSLALIVAILLQAKGAGLGGIFGGEGGIYKSRRGVERTLFNITIGLVVIFFIVSVATVFLQPS